MQRSGGIGIAAFISGITPSLPAGAQCLECAQQMFQAILATNIWYNIHQDHIDQTRNRDA